MKQMLIAQLVGSLTGILLPEFASLCFRVFSVKKAVRSLWYHLRNDFALCAMYGPPAFTLGAHVGSARLAVIRDGEVIKGGLE